MNHDDGIDQLRVIFHPLVLDVEVVAFPEITLASLGLLEASR